MTSSVSKGNNPELWEKLLEVLDEKLQLGLLDKLRRVASYHFESDTLFIEAGTDDDDAYLRKSATLHQLVLFAQDATRVKDVVLKPRDR